MRLQTGAVSVGLVAVLSACASPAGLWSPHQSELKANSARQGASILQTVLSLIVPRVRRNTLVPVFWHKADSEFYRLNVSFRPQAGL